MDFEKVLKLSAKKLSEDQRKVVFSNRATIVSAGAGSGKTTVLSLRFLRLVNDGVDADRILTITFTKKAAAEMYGRIHALLSAMAEADDNFGLQLKDKFPNAAISTMDSFWTEIARSGCLKYGISRDFSLEDSDTRKRLINKVYTTLTTASTSVDAICPIVSNAEIVDGLNILSSYIEPSTLADALDKIADNTNILTELSPDTDKEFYMPLITYYCIKYDPISRIKLILNEMASIAGHVSSKCSKSIFLNGEYDKAQLALSQLDKKCENLSDLIGIIRDSDLSSFPELKVGNAKQADSPEANKAIKDVYLKAYREALEELKALRQMIINEPHQVSIDKAFRAFVYLYNREKRARAILSFADVQAIAKEVLTKDLAIRDYYKSRFDYIMVDEFQDNNIEQRNLLYLLSERCDIHSEGIPRAEDLDPKKLFLVGDDKQSIYRFRGADVSVFNSLKQEIVDKMNGLSLTLGANYRSEPQLVNHFNDVFSHVFEADEYCTDRNEEVVSLIRGFEEGDYRAEARGIDAGRALSDFSPVIELATIPYEKRSREENAKFLSSNESESIYIAEKILDMVNGDEYMIPDSNGGLRRPDFDDIGVLYRTSSIQMSLEKEFRHRGIPYTVVESTSSTLDGIAYDIFNFLQIVAYPEDKLAFMSVINSPFARISPSGQDFLLGDAEGFEAFCEDVVFDDPCDKAAYENLKTLYEKVKNMVGRESLPSILDELYYSSGYHTYIQSSGNLSMYSEHYDYLWTLANELDGDGLGIVEVLDYLRPIVGKAGKLDKISIGRIESRGVKLMTIHKSKGLEFPIVMVAAMGDGFKSESSPFINVSTANQPFIGWDLSDLITEDGVKNPYSGIFNKWTDKRLKAEHKRILYVALTRAVNHLILIAKEPSDSGSSESLYTIYKRALDEAMEGDEQKNWDIKFSFVPLIEKQSNIGSLSSLKRDLIWYENAASYPEPIWNKKKVAAKDASHVDIESSEKGYRLPSLSIDSITAEHPSFRTGFGSWVHQALEEKLSGAAAITEFECDSEVEAKNLDLLLSEAKRIADDFVSTDFYRENVGECEVGTEIEFYYPDEDRVLQGSADLVVFKDDYNLVIDYKTDKYKTPAEHKGQITTYVRAMEELYGKKCYGRLCYVRDFSAGPIWDKDGNEVEL